MVMVKGVSDVSEAQVKALAAAAAMLEKIVNCSAPAGVDSSDWPMRKVRAALIDQAAAVAAEAKAAIEGSKSNV
jgi:hypothetical protein